MTQEAYVSFEIAKLLKEKGFNAEIDTYYTPEGELKIWCTNEIKSHLDNNGIETWCWKCIAPTQQMAMRWLREVHNLYIVVNIAKLSNGGHYVYYEIKDNDGKIIVSTITGTHYEEAVEAALKYVLKNLI